MGTTLSCVHSPTETSIDVAGGDDSGGGACRLTAPPTAATEACKPVEIYGPVRPAQPTFVSPQLPEVWRCVKATWQQPLKTKAPIATMAGIVKVVDRSDTTCPGVPPSLDESLAAHLLPRLVGRRVNVLCPRTETPGISG